MKQGWQISGQTDESSLKYPELPHTEPGLLGLYMPFAQLPGSCWGKWCDFGWFSVSVSDREGDDYRRLSTDGALRLGSNSFLRKEFGSSFTILVTVPEFTSPYILKAAPTGF